MNNEFAEEHCIVDGTPLSDSEIELIRAMRKYYIFTVLGTGEYDEQFSVVHVDNDYKLRYLDGAVVIEMLDSAKQEHLANIFKQIQAEK